jgi:hypothetical protein
LGAILEGLILELGGIIGVTTGAATGTTTGVTTGNTIGCKGTGGNIGGINEEGERWGVKMGTDRGRAVGRK